MTPRAVVFDIGNVLIEWQPERYFDRLCGPERRRTMFAEIDIHAMMTRIDSGAHFGDEAASVAEAHPDFAAELLHFRDHWCDIAQPAIPHSVRLMQALRARGVPVFALSNFGAENFPLSAAQFPFLQGFDRAYISGQMRLAKPDPAIYAAVEADCGLPPEALFFTDDRAENIEAAAARGWQVHRFDHAAGLARALVAQRLLAAEEAR